MAQDSAPGARRVSLFFPILLIALGVIFLYAERHPDFDPWPILRTYWPLILIFLGVAKIWDSARTRYNPPSAPGPSFGGIVAAIALVALFVVLMRHGRRPFGRWGGDTVYAMQHSDSTVDRDDAKTVSAHIEMNTGDLDLSGGASHLLEANFDYRSSVAPKVDYAISGVTGNLDIRQGDAGSTFSASDNHWTLHLANNVPIDLRIDMGAGRGNLRLRDINLTDFALHMGAGQVDLDLTGDRKSDLTASVQGGVGEADIRLPKNIGVVVNASGGLGTIDTRGLRKDGDEYINDAYGKSNVTIHLKVEGGIGRISLSEE